MAALALMAVDRRYGHLNDFRIAVANLVDPIEHAAQLPGKFVETAGDYTRRQDALLSENEALRDQNLYLRVRLQQLQALENENNRLRTLLDSPRKPGQRVLVSNIIGANSDRFQQSVRIDKGLRHGVYEGQTAVDAYGVLGQVTSVETNSAEVLLISDVNHELPAQILRTGQRAVAAGSGDNSALRLRYLPLDADVQIGDVVTTSGLGGRFPADIPVGTVTSVQTAPGQQFLQVKISPDAKLNRTRDVVLVWPEVPVQGEVAASDPTTATQ